MKAKRRNTGFTLVEVLVSIALMMMSMQICFQMSGIYSISTMQLNENQQMLTLAQATRNRVEADMPDGWSAVESDESHGNLVYRNMTIHHGDTSHWQIAVVDAANRGKWNP